MRPIKWKPWFKTEQKHPWQSHGTPILKPALQFLFKGSTLLFGCTTQETRDSKYNNNNKKQSSCGKVKVEVDLVEDLPKRIHVDEEDGNIRKISSEWITIKECCLQPATTVTKLPYDNLLRTTV